MEPKRGITVAAVQVGARQISEDSQVWVWESSDSLLEIECRGQRGREPRDAIAFSPVLAPEQIFSRYQARSDNWLKWQGRSL